MLFGSGPCPVLIPSCSWALSGSIWQALSEFRPKRCQTCSETAGELQPCSWFCPCSYTWCKFISLFGSTYQHARDHPPSGSSLCSSNSRMQDEALDPQKEQHLASHPVCVTCWKIGGSITAVHGFLCRLYCAISILAITLQADSSCFAPRKLGDILAGHHEEGCMLAAQFVHCGWRWFQALHSPSAL